MTTQEMRYTREYVNINMRSRRKISRQPRKDYKKGDKVVLIRDWDSEHPDLVAGLVGTVLEDVSKTSDIPVYFGKGFGGHSCNGLDPSNNSYYMYSKCMKLTYRFSKRAFKIFTKDYIKVIKSLDIDEEFYNKCKEKLIKKRIEKSPMKRSSKEFKEYIFSNPISFPGFSTNYPEHDTIISGLKQFISTLGIKKIAFEKEITVNKYQDEMTLWMFPKGREFKEVLYDDDYNTIGKLMNKGFDLMARDYIRNSFPQLNDKYHMRAYKINNRYTIVCGNVLLYIPEKNIVIMLANPFINHRVFPLTLNKHDLFYNDVNNIEFKFRTKKESDNFLYREVWGSGIKKELKVLKGHNNASRADMRHLEKQFRGVLERIKNEELKMYRLKEMINKDIIKTRLEEEIKKSSKLPFVKSISMKNTIHVEIGEIYIPHKVQGGYTKNERGIRVPKMENRKIYIGYMYIDISPSGIKVSSKEFDEDEDDEVEYPHPHVNDDKTPCFGDIEFDVTRLLSEMNIYDLIKLLYSWIISYNKESAYWLIEEFYYNLKQR